MKRLLYCLSMLPMAALGAPFDTCPSKAFLVQGNTATLFGVNLVSGSYDTLAADLATNNKLNGFGFSVHDRYLYGWDYQSGGLARVGQEYEIEPLAATGFPSTNFYVGDVAVETNHYYAYRRGSGYGLYRTALDESDPLYLQAQRVIDGAALNLNIFDLAFHPTSNFAYSVDSNGFLHRIDVSDGSSSNIGNTGFSGTFGAVYFDVDGNFYISRNQDGHIFLVDITLQNETVLFAYGPSSSSNDGARCATAPIIDESEPASIDFGDAPDSYGTSLGSNGARHSVGDLYLGATVSAEYYPNDPDNDDGVQFITTLEKGLDALISVTSSKSGYLNAWFDWNNDGVFSEDEQAVESYTLSNGENRLLIDVPLTATSGTIWSRFRVSPQASVASTGGVANGEVEDYQVTTIDSGITMFQSSWQTTAFEDNWPEQGDYDFNDVVVKYRVSMSQKDNSVVRYRIEGELLAVGASYHNGFALRFNNILRSQVNEAMIRYEIDGQRQTSSPLEANRTEAIIIVFPDTRTIVPATNDCQYFRTSSTCQSQSTVPFNVTLPLLLGVDSNEVSLTTPSAFIFGVNGFYHGDYVDINNARSWEVHAKNSAPTEAFNAALYGQGQDDSLQSGFFQTQTGLPWALKVNANWQHPKEHIDLLQVYPQFTDFAVSAGLQNTTWFNFPKMQYAINNED